MRYLKLFMIFVFIFMLVNTVKASLELNLFSHLPVLIRDPWAVMTLYDAYFAFLFFYIWVFYKEESIYLRVLWLLLILTTGTMAMSAYVLMETFKLKEGEGVSELLLRRK